MNLKMKSWKGGGLKGAYLVTWKLDGVCVILNGKDRTAMSKHGKSLYGFEEVFDTHPDIEGTFECFRKNWETSVSLVRRQDTPRAVSFFDLYRLDPVVAQLRHEAVRDPSEYYLKETLAEAKRRGYEGLVLVPLGDIFGQPLAGATLIKVKPTLTVDVRVIGIQPGTGKHAGRMGALLTGYGKVGTGFTDADRDMFGIHGIGPVIIEVEIMEWTPGGKMRHPRFIRVRNDKTEENLEGFNHE